MNTFLILFSILAAVGGGLASFFSQRNTNEQNQRNYEDWKSYNTPANQMQRLTDAGLNPYMVNGVTNTLSQPFNIQNNTGLSSLFEQLSSASSHGANTLNAMESNQIKKISTDLQREGLTIRRDMVDIARKRGDAYSALLWSQGTLADINANFWREVADSRVSRYLADTRIRNYFANDLYPLQLSFYKDYYPELIANKQADTDLKKTTKQNILWSQWFRKYELENVLAQRVADRMLRSRALTLNTQLGYDRLMNDAQISRGRLGLQRDYYDLANWKFWLSLPAEYLNFYR